LRIGERVFERPPARRAAEDGRIICFLELSCVRTAGSALEAAFGRSVWRFHGWVQTLLNAFGNTQWRGWPF